MNKVLLLGRIVNDLELTTYKEDLNVLNFTLAVRRKIRTERGPDTDFINCVAWRKDAEFICRNFVKGDSIYIVGTLNNNQYTDGNGNKQYGYKVSVEEVYFTGSSLKKK